MTLGVDARPKVSVVIPHLKGDETLFACLASLRRSAFRDFEILLVDNASRDGSVPRAKGRFPELCVIPLMTNEGFAGGCNAGIRAARGDYVFLLNDDAEVLPETMGNLVTAVERDPKVAACQPKILSWRDPTQFEYAGAAGGLLDCVGYPFCLGRVFEHPEEDHGQYDQERDIFWASGAASLFRRSTMLDVGLMDEVFFAQMEEIDLCWRLHLAGFAVRAVPSAVVYHRGAGTLGKSEYQKLYLNHRNNLVMLLKNLALPALLWRFPLRLWLDEVTFFRSLMIGEYDRVWALLATAWYLLGHPGRIMKMRASAQKVRRIPDAKVFEKTYHGLLPFEYFVKGRKTVPG
jgi:GT2 family glycosyltransferase